MKPWMVGLMLAFFTGMICSTLDDIHPEFRQTIYFLGFVTVATGIVSVIAAFCDLFGIDK